MIHLKHKGSCHLEIITNFQHFSSFCWLSRNSTTVFNFVESLVSSPKRDKIKVNMPFHVSTVSSLKWSISAIAFLKLSIFSFNISSHSCHYSGLNWFSRLLRYRLIISIIHFLLKRVSSFRNYSACWLTTKKKREKKVFWLTDWVLRQSMQLIIWK